MLNIQHARRNMYVPHRPLAAPSHGDERALAVFSIASSLLILAPTPLVATTPSGLGRQAIGANRQPRGSTAQVGQAGKAAYGLR